MNENPRMTKSVGVRDIPIELEKEDISGLNVSDYAIALTEFIKQTESPMTIGIQGDWGSGKTSLMNLIQGRLGGDYPTLWINTWKYAQTEPGQSLAVAILLAIIHRLTEQTAKEKTKLFVQNFGKALLSLGGKVAESQLGVNVVTLLAKGELEKVFEQYEALDKLKGQLNELVKVVVADKSTRCDRVVVFVDDLDRVQPERAVEILEVLKVFLDIPGLVFVLACDYEVILQGLRAKAGLGGEEVSGRSFFDKIIQVPFQMPLHSQDKLENYIGGLFKRVGASTTQPADITKMVEVLRLTTGTNPRTIKRLINILNLLLLVLDNAKHKWDDAIENKASIVFTLVALQNAFPEAYAHLSSRSTDEMFQQFNNELMLEDVGLKRLIERRRDLTPETLNGVLDVVKTLVNDNGDLLSQFIRVSDIAAVHSKEEMPKPSDGPTRRAKSYVLKQPKEIQSLIGKVIEDLPSDVEFHTKTEGKNQFLYVHLKGKSDDYSAYLLARPTTRCVEFGFTATATEPFQEDGNEDTFFSRMKSFGCPNIEVGSDVWDEWIYCSLSTDADKEQIDAVRNFVHWFVLKAPELRLEE